MLHENPNDRGTIRFIIFRSLLPVISLMPALLFPFKACASDARRDKEEPGAKHFITTVPDSIKDATTLPFTAQPVTTIGKDKIRIDGLELDTYLHSSGVDCYVFVFHMADNANRVEQIKFIVPLATLAGRKLTLPYESRPYLSLHNSNYHEPPYVYSLPVSIGINSALKGGETQLPMSTDVAIIELIEAGNAKSDRVTRLCGHVEFGQQEGSVMPVSLCIKFLDKRDRLFYLNGKFKAAVKVEPKSTQLKD